MTATELYYFIEGIALMFFGIMAAQNLWQRDHRLRFILGWVLLYWTVQHLLSVVFAPAYLSETRRFEYIISAFDITAAPTCCLPSKPIGTGSFSENAIMPYAAIMSMPMMPCTTIEPHSGWDKSKSSGKQSVLFWRRPENIVKSF